MALALSPIGVRALSGASTAYAAQSVAGSFPAANNQHQRWTQTARGNARRGLSAPIYAAEQSNRLVHSPSRRPVRHSSSRIGLHFPAERHRAARGGFYSVQVFGANRSPAQSVSDQPLKQLAVRVIDHFNALSSLDLLVGFDANEKVLTHGTISLPSRGKSYD